MANRAIRLITAMALVFCSVFFIPSAASAHSLAKDGKISAFLHIAPDDIPQPGKTNTVHFYINDQDFRFSMEGCDCKVKVNQGDKVLYSGPLLAEGTRVGKINVFLPANDFSYAVTLGGTPKTAGFFQPFKLDFDIDVGNPPTAAPSRSHKIIVPVTGVVLLVGGLGYYTIHIKRTKLKR